MQLSPLFPPQKPWTDKPNLDHRTIINGILWVLRTGAPWRDLPERYGKWKTISSRLDRWGQTGCWNRILAVLQAQADAADELDQDAPISIAPSSVPTSTRLEQRGPRKRGLRPQSGRVWQQAAPAL